MLKALLIAGTGLVTIVGIGCYFGITSRPAHLLYMADLDMDTMNEDIVMPDEIENENPGILKEPKGINWRRYIYNRNNRLLDTSRSDYGWKAVKTVYKHTLKSISEEKLIEQCRELMEGEIRGTLKTVAERKTRIAQKFCSFPIKVQHKLDQRTMEKFLDLPDNPNNNEPFTKDKCLQISSGYTVFGDVTLKEIDFIKKCYHFLVTK